MSKESLEKFMSQVAESEELQARIGEETDANTLIALGAESGCEFTAEDLQESAELSDEELDGIAGGSLSRVGELALTLPGLPNSNQPARPHNGLGLTWRRTSLDGGIKYGVRES
jgi:predicted ribosomally synthesized peptide with nif11-like leader